MLASTYHLILWIAVDEFEEYVLLDSLTRLWLFWLLYMLKKGAYAAITAAESSWYDGLTFFHYPIHMIIHKIVSTDLR